MIIGAGVLDDMIEVFLVALVSMWIGKKTGEMGGDINPLIVYPKEEGCMVADSRIFLSR